MSHQRKPEINFNYIFNYTYNPTYTNGVQGGFTPRGELVMHFYQERPALPKEVTHEITPEGGIGAMTEADPKNLNGTMVRFIETGVTMNFQTAAMIHAWLGEQLGQMQAVLKAQAEFMQGGAPETAAEDQ
ncbi:MAG: hypothetical protein AB7T17_06930 [Geobacter sp.]|jgi:hypothetical protein